MAAIDLLFDVKNDSEKLHQIILGPMFTKTNLLNFIFKDISSKPRDFLWEPKHGLFDLQVVMDNDTNVWIEIKIDSTLENDQKCRQLDFIKTQPKDRLCYMLLGYSACFLNQYTLIGELKEQLKCPSDGFAVVTASEIIHYLQDSRILQEIGIKTRDMRDLVICYRDALHELNRRTSEYHLKSSDNWNDADWIGFFAECRRRCPSMESAGSGYVYRASGGFIGCWWSFVRLNDEPEVDIYLQFEYRRLCFKISCNSKDARGDMRNEVSRLLLDEAAGSNIAVSRPQHFGRGWSMTVAVCDNPIISGQVDWDSIAKSISAAERLIQKVSNHFSKS